MSSTPVRLGVVMDPIGAIRPAKDSTFAMLLAAQARGWQLHYMELADLNLRDGEARGRWRELTVADRSEGYHQLGAEGGGPLAELDVVLMRKDPPFDSEYVYATYILERAQDAGALVVNDPRALREVQEKLSVARYPGLAPPTLVARDAQVLRDFIAEQGRAVLKPLDGMGGRSIFVLTAGEPNVNVVLETLTDEGRRYAMAQRFLPEISQGDKRILLVDGEVVPHALARIPSGDDHRGNLAQGGRGEVVPLTDRDREIAQAVAQELTAQGLLFVGLDVIGDHLTEINVTSPTCIREIDAATGSDVAGQLMDALAQRLSRRSGS